jgi:hypothetical protein
MKSFLKSAVLIITIVTGFSVRSQATWPYDPGNPSNVTFFVRGTGLFDQRVYNVAVSYQIAERRPASLPELAAGLGPTITTLHTGSGGIDRTGIFTITPRGLSDMGTLSIIARATVTDLNGTYELFGTLTNLTPGSGNYYHLMLRPVSEQVELQNKLEKLILPTIE